MAELADARDSKSRIHWMWGFDSPSGYKMSRKIGYILLFFSIISISIVVYQIRNVNKYGNEFIEQIRLADSDNLLVKYPEEELIDLGKDICNTALEWASSEESNIVIHKLINFNPNSLSQVNIDKDNRLIPILRFHSIYELCPEHVSSLERIFTTDG